MKNLSKVIAGSILAGALTLLPVSGEVRSANAGTEITDSQYYDGVRNMQMDRGREYLENLKIEREKRFLIVERHLLKKGANPREYFEKRTSDSQAVFKGNELKIVYLYISGQIPDVKPLNMNLEEDRRKGLEEFVAYLRELKSEGYRALTRLDSTNFSDRLKNARQIGIDELIEETYKLEALLEAKRQKK